ncbi:MAG TPA: 2OG-Fe(II) oxygenase family protein [Caulobacteraceae bacterium]
MTPLRIAPGFDPRTGQAAFKRFGRLHIPDFLTAPSARALADTIVRVTPWMRTINRGSDSFELPVAEVEAYPPEEQQAFANVVYGEARRGFQFLYDRWRLSVLAEAGEPVPPGLRAAYDFLNGPEFLGFAQALTGDTRPTFVDAQVTRYLPGHFLTSHNDSKPDAGRLYAYVLNLSPEWRADWGGLLLFLDEDGHVAEGYTPAFNALNIFRVPANHAVSIVAPFADAPRLAITGWIRHGSVR